MSYGDLKAVATDLTKLALNGSPYWRLAVTATLLVLCIGSVWGYHNFARADAVDQKITAANAPILRDLEAIKRQQDRSEIKDITESLLNSKRDQCEATREGRNARGWTNRITELMDEYFLLTKKPFDMPDCKEV